MLCGECPEWEPGGVMFPVGRIGDCGRDGSTTTRTSRCRFPRPEEDNMPMKEGKIVTNRRPDINNSDLKHMKAAGMNIKDIAAHYNTTCSTVQNRLKKIDMDNLRELRAKKREDITRAEDDRAPVDPDQPVKVVAEADDRAGAPQMGTDPRKPTINQGFERAFQRAMLEPLKPQEDFTMSPVGPGVQVNTDAEPVRVSPWNAHVCENMPAPYCIVIGEDGLPAILLGECPMCISPINVCPWCGAKLVDAGGSAE